MLDSFQPRDPNFQTRVTSSFRSQPMMVHLGARLALVEPGAVDVELPFQSQLTQHNGFLHGGTISTIADTACGYAAYSLLAQDEDVLTVEFKINYLSPGVGDRFVAQGRVLRFGKTLIISQGDVFAFERERKKHVATILATLMCITR